MYYIYHIKGVKIGCSTQVNKRIKEQGFSDCEILEEHLDIYVASDREIELQKKYGYKVDTTPYWQSSQRLRKNATFKSASKGGKKGGATSKRLGHIQKAQKIGCSIGGSITGSKSKEDGRLYKMTLRMIEVTSKPVIATNIKTNEQFTFNSQNEAARQLKVSGGNLSKVLNGIGKTLGGYKWDYQN
jgi:hypothetical protein